MIAATPVLYEGRVYVGTGTDPEHHDGVGWLYCAGVGFRRAFIEVRVQVGETTVWASGGTDQWGVIGRSVGGQFTPLPTEFFEKNQFQPHFDTITREDQVQIFEALAKDSRGDITTSFLGLKTEVKDNRLLPKGWRPDGPHAAETGPKGVLQAKNAWYYDGSRTDVVRYEIPLAAGLAGPFTVTATLYYQSLPPYYLRQRFMNIDKPAAQNLFYFVSTLKLGGDLKGWKLKIAHDSATAP
jgi:hypothetical protein